MKKILLILVALSTVIALQVPVFAQGTILPEAARDKNTKEINAKACDELINYFNKNGSFQTSSDGGKTINTYGPGNTLGCAISTGRISLPMVPYFIQYFSNYALGLVSILALLFVVIGGFLYTLGGLTEQKDKGKNYIKNALIGMVIAFMAWTIVNVILSAITG